MKKVISLWIALLIVFTGICVPDANGVFAAWDGYFRDVGDKFSALNFNSLSAVLNTRGMTSSAHAKNGNRYSIYWADHLVNTDIYIDLKDDVPADWSSYDKITIDIYSEKATNATIFLGFFSTSNAYYSTKFTVNWEGWKTLQYAKTDLTSNRTPTWENIYRVRFVGHGNWSITGDPETELYIASVNVSRNDSSTSVDDIYTDETVDNALAAMKDSVGVYGNGVNGVNEKGASALGYEIDHVNKTTMIPAKLFKEYLGATVSDNGKSFSVNLGGKTISGEAGSTKVKTSDGEAELGLAPYQKDGMVFFPGAEVAMLLGKAVYVDGRLLVIGTDEAVKAVTRPEKLGVNELNEVVSYLSYHRDIDVNSFSEEDAKQVKDNWRTYLVGNEETNDMSDPDIAAKVKSIEKEAQNAWDSLIKEEGSAELFKGIKSTKSAHMSDTYEKINTMTEGWATYGSALYKNEKLEEDIKYALEWGYKYRYSMQGKENWKYSGQNNWFDWEIATPRELLNVLLLMESEFTFEEIQKYCEYFDYRCPIAGRTGANFAMITECIFKSSLLQNDFERLISARSAFEKLYLYVDDNERSVEWRLKGTAERIAKTPVKGAGPFTDGSYVLHTLHAMNIAYGPSHFSPLCRFENVFVGTKLETNTPARYNIPDMFFNVFASVIYGTTTYTHVRGRGENANLFDNGTSLIANAFSIADKFDPEDRDLIYATVKTALKANPDAKIIDSLSISQIKNYKKIIADETIKPLEDLNSHKVFYNMDKVVHKRNDWSVGISMSSERIFNYESINSSNATGWYFGDGRTEWFLFGDKINTSSTHWVNMDRYRLPGTTVDTQERLAVNINQGYEYLSSKDFVGGVSHDGTYGVSAMDLESFHNSDVYADTNSDYGAAMPLHTNDLVAKKSYFMFDDEFVCLGSGVNAKNNNNAEVLTIVDNLSSYETVSMSDQKESEPHKILSAVATSTPEAENVAENTIDTDSTSKWASEAGAEIVWDLGETKPLGFVLFSFASGTKRKQLFELQTSVDSVNWTSVFNGESSGTKDTDEAFDLKGVNARYVKFINGGNTGGSSWVSICDAKIYPPNSDGSIGFKEADVFGNDKIIADGNRLTVLGDDVVLSGINWLNYADKCGYVFPKVGTANIGELKARYTKGNNSHFELWFSHGINPTDSRYEYIVLPGKTDAETKAYVEKGETKVLVNNEKIQAVKDESLNTTGIVFWEKGSLDKINVSHPLIVMYTETKDGFVISASDPTQKLTEAQITINMPLELVDIDDMATSETTGNTTTLTLNLNGSTGRSFEAVYKK